MPKLASSLPLAIPKLLALGKPNQFYPWHWSIYHWIEGENAGVSHPDGQNIFAVNLGNFLKSLHKIDTTNGPQPGMHNFHRGGDLVIYDDETRQAILKLDKQIDVEKALTIWQEACQIKWTAPPVWVHGDISAGNLIVNNGKLTAVIDFGGLGIGDPACDLVIKWTYLRGTSQKIFKSQLNLDEATWARARGWALWKALIVIAGHTGTNQIELNQAQSVLDQVLQE